MRREPEDREGIKAVLEAAHERALLDAESYQMIRGALAVSEGIVADIMVPRSRMDLLDVTQPIPYLVASVIETAHSRFPVYEGDRDNIIGILLAKDLLRCMLEPGIEVRSLVRPAVFIPESKRLNVLLREFRVSRNHQAIVIDEHGGISGLVTMEDVLEQIVGDIEDEFDETEEDSIFPRARTSGACARPPRSRTSTTCSAASCPTTSTTASAAGWAAAWAASRAVAITPKSTVCASRSPAATPAAPSGCVCDAWPGPIPPQSHRSMSPTPRGRLLRGAAGLTLAGAAHALTFAPGPLPGWALAITQVLALAVAARVTLYAPSARQSWARGWLFSFATYALGLYWIFISLHRYGDLAAPLAAAAVLLLSAFLAIFPATACALARRYAPLEPDSPPARALTGALTWAALWAGFEWVRAVLLTGFPWLNIGYAHVDSPLAGWAPLLGVHGMALLAAFAAAAIATLWQPSRKTPLDGRRALAAGLALALAATGWLLARIDWSRPFGEPLNVRLIQGNIEQSQKFDPALLDQSLRRHLELAALPPMPGEPAPQLTILPETVMPVFQNQLDPRVWEAWRAIAARQNSVIAMGSPLLDVVGGRERYTNSVIGFDGATPVEHLLAGSTAMRYDKRHLVPWGEYVPPGFHWFVDMLDIPLGDFDRGAERQTPFAVGGQHVAFNICYEDLFGPDLLPALQPGPQGEPGATILVNVSNLGWFGDSWALRQHLQIGRLRTIETARPMLTATNTGITAAIDAKGHVAAQLAPMQPGVLPVSVQGMTGLTPTPASATSSRWRWWAWC